LSSAPGFAQTPPAPPALPAFEVASVKPSPPIVAAQVLGGKIHIGMSVDGARVDIGNLSLRELLWRAYRVRPYQISGPDWLGGQRFDIAAKLPEGTNAGQVPEMLQALLAERFKLVAHTEGKEQSVYGLVAGKNGAKLKVSDAPPGPAGPPAAPPAGESSQMSISRDANGVTISGGSRLGAGLAHVSMGANGALHLEATQVTMERFADLLTSLVDRPVVDMTGIKGNYDVGLDLSMEDMRNVAGAAGVMMPMRPMRGGDAGMRQSPVASDPSGSSIFTAVEQLGLKLEPRKDRVTLIVIDHVEKMPTEN
jgi:uncharacterized protein (TIGR03435 family)